MPAETNSIHIDESYWVLPDRFRAGEYPGSINDSEARRKLRWLLDQGINLFLDLTEAGEYGLRPYEKLLYVEASKLHAIVLYKRLPLHDFNRPTPKVMVEILDTIDLAIAEGKNIYLHCYGGKGRTGTVVGCYLARHGIAGENALTMIQELRKEMPGKYEKSPETDNQRKMVMEWTMDR
jgi:protein-tyrosine phosphatase